MKNLLNIDYLQDINQNTPENPSGELLVFLYGDMVKHQTSSY
jgi:hypothetical protein